MWSFRRVAEHPTHQRLESHWFLDSGKQACFVSWVCWSWQSELASVSCSSLPFLEGEKTKPQMCMAGEAEITAK